MLCNHLCGIGQFHAGAVDVQAGNFFSQPAKGGPVGRGRGNSFIKCWLTDSFERSFNHTQRIDLP